MGDEPPGTYEICPVCFWEDDPVQFNDPNYAEGANEVSLKEARKNFRKFGASTEGVKDEVRPPLDSERLKD